MLNYDKGPNLKIARLFAGAPDYTAYKEHFWYDWGPVFYRGRLDRSARLLCVASDPGPTERVAGRTLVGDAGQRVQGFLAKLGLTRSYVCLNAFIYALFPGSFWQGQKILADPQHVEWRNRLFNQVTGPALQAVVAFGAQAQLALDHWDNPAQIPVVRIVHPSYREEDVLLAQWKEAVVQLRAILTPDPDGRLDLANYGDKFLEQDYAPIPRRDLPFGVPDWLGDDAWGRSAKPRHNNCVERPNPDDRHTLTWIAPVSP